MASSQDNTETRDPVTGQGGGVVLTWVLIGIFLVLVAATAFETHALLMEESASMFCSVVSISVSMEL